MDLFIPTKNQGRIYFSGNLFMEFLDLSDSNIE